MRYIILLFALTLSIAKASAQDVLNEVLRTSDAIINDTTKSMDERRTALFKFDAMTYMRSKILPPYVMLDKNLSKDTLNIKVRYLNEQAYAMSVYITLYQRRLKEASNKNKPLVTQFFKQKTAYEIYQCDWSSDVCSSDLRVKTGKKTLGSKIGKNLK